MLQSKVVFESGQEKRKVFKNQDIILGENIAEGGLVFRDCKISNVNATINNCTFENCEIDCGGLINCTLISCSVSVYDIGITNCEFQSPIMINVTRCAVTNCSFEDISCDNEGVILPEDSKIIGCRFVNVRLRNGAHLISGIGNCCVRNCRFENCATERDDLQIICCEDVTGKFIKKRRVCLVETSDCRGLESIEPL